MGTIADKLNNGLKEGISAIIEAGTTDKEKTQAAIAELAQRQAKLAEDEVTNQINTSKEKITLAELTQGDTYTKRARPTVVYAGLVFIFIVHVLLPVIANLKGGTPPNVTLPQEFWWAWTGVVSTWVLGRSYEKSKGPAPLSKIITGTK